MNNFEHVEVDSPNQTCGCKKCASQIVVQTITSSTIRSASIKMKWHDVANDSCVGCGISAEDIVARRLYVCEGLSYSEQREILINDLKGKLQREDFHGVRDACVDIEVLDARNRQ